MRRIAGFRLVTDDPARLSRFFAEAFGARVGNARPIPPAELVRLGLSGSGTRTRVTLGDQWIDLDRYEQAGKPYQEAVGGNDLRFQHFALVTDDAAVAWARARGEGAVPISRNGPVTLPASSGGVTAVKFRDPDGHPLELLQFPPGADVTWRGTGVFGIDHSAISVADAARSRAFYEGWGLNVGHANLNRGREQDALDGLCDVAVDVVPMQPPNGGPPHLELLGYRSPGPQRAEPLVVNDVAATRVVWVADHDDLHQDPDGHWHEWLAGRGVGPTPPQGPPCRRGSG